MAKRKTGGREAPQANCGRRYRLMVPPMAHERMVGWGHTRRALYNAALTQRQLAFKACGVTLRAWGQAGDLTEARGNIDWLAELPAQAAQQALADLDRAYENWWNPGHSAGPPTRQKRDGRLSFRLPGQAIEIRHVGRKWSEVWVPKLGWLGFRRHRALNGQVRSARFAFSPGSGWHVSFGVAAKQRKAPRNDRPGVGVDFGVACSAFLSDETTSRLMAPSLTAGEQRRLLGLERRKARQVTFAKRHNGGRYSRRLRRTISQIGELLAYKAPWYGSEFRLVLPRNTSRECSRCGHIDPENRLGCGRAFACVSCGHVDHADRNAAVNIKRLAALQEAQTAGPAGAKAHDSTGRRKPSHALKERRRIREATQPRAGRQSRMSNAAEAPAFRPGWSHNNMDQSIEMGRRMAWTTVGERDAGHEAVATESEYSG